MINKHEFNELNYEHLTEYNHFNNNYKCKPICSRGPNCGSFLRMAKKSQLYFDGKLSNFFTSMIVNNINVNGNNTDEKEIDETDCYNFEDECHLLLYRHPPRDNRQCQLSKNMKHLIINSDIGQLETFTPLMKWLDRLIKTKPIKSLIQEVITNGFEKDLCLNGKDYRDKHYSILTIVNKKYDCKTHKRLGQPLDRAQLLSLILYTDCECNFDLCASQRTNDFIKWVRFDQQLHSAIRTLNYCESYIKCKNLQLFSGLEGVQCNKNEVLTCYFPTYMSTSTIKDVSLRFAKNNGMFFFHVAKNDIDEVEL